MKDLFHFIQLSSSERKGAIFLIVLLVVLQLILHFLPEKPETEEESSAYADFSSFIASYQANREADSELMPFNPNTLDSEGWQSLGFTERQAESILNFRSLKKGFYTEEELLSSFLVDSAMIEAWRPFFIWEDRPEPAFQPSSFTEDDDKIKHRSKPERKALMVELNSADSAQLIAVRGIGPTTAGRIVRFRELIGGFHSLAQLAEVWGFREENRTMAMEQLRVNSELVKPLCINEIDRDKLSNHPYFQPNLARVIIAYREEHGPFKEAEDLLKTKVVTDSVFNKIKPYVDLCQ